MELVIARHAKAVPQGFENLPDAERPLAPDGAAQAEALGRLFARIKWLPDKVYSSPLLRARQTTGAVIHSAGIEPVLEFTPALRSGTTTKEIQEFLAWRVSRRDRVLIVGHQPDFGEFICSLINNPHAALQLPPCGLARVDIERPDEDWSGYLVWLLTPDFFS